MDIICLAFMLVGVIMMIRAQVLKHKGMWDLRNDDALFHRSLNSPYEVTSAGGIFFALGLIAEIGYTFGLKAGLWSTVAVAVINAVINVIWLKHIETDDKELRAHAVALIILSAFVLFIAGLMLFLI